MLIKLDRSNFDSFGFLGSQAGGVMLSTYRVQLGFMHFVGKICKLLLALLTTLN